MKTLILLISFLFSSFFTPYTFSQVGIEDFSSQIQSVAKYATGSGESRMIELFNKVGYTPPDYLRKEWGQYPAIRKIEMAYQAAENANKGNGGQKLLTMLKSLAQKYDGEEPPTPSKIDFKHSIESPNEIKLSRRIRNKILDISKWVDNGALGGVQGTLKKFGLSNDEVYDILRNSKSSQEALEKGLYKSPVPPPHKERLRNIRSEIVKKYESAKYDESFKDLDEKSKKVPEKIAKKLPQREITTRPDNKLGKANYATFEQKNYGSPNERKFSQMKSGFKGIRGLRGGFGGVIFGNTVTDNTNLPNITNIRLIPNEDYKSREGLDLGSLVFIFEDSSEYWVEDVFVEDVLAASEIVNDTTFYEGDGVGLVGITGGELLPDTTRKLEAIIHPAINNLDLGWAALLTDALPIAYDEMLEKAEKSCEDKGSILKSWSCLGRIDYWKIIDVPLSISEDDGSLLVERDDMLYQLPDVYITMQGFHEHYLSTEEDGFYESVPCLTSSIYEFDRINKFAKTFALFRWAKQKGGKLTNLPVFKNYKNSPEGIYITKDRKIAYRSLEEEQKYFKVFKETQIKELNNLLNTSDISPEIKKLNEVLLDSLKQRENYMDTIVTLLKNKDRNVCDKKLPLPPSLSSYFEKMLKIHNDIKSKLSLQKQELEVIRKDRDKFLTLSDSLLSKFNSKARNKYESLIKEMKTLPENEHSKKQKLLNDLRKLLSEEIPFYCELSKKENSLTVTLTTSQREVSNFQQEKWKTTYDKLESLLEKQYESILLAIERFCEEK